MTAKRYKMQVSVEKTKSVVISIEFVRIFLSIDNQSIEIIIITDITSEGNLRKKVTLQINKSI